ncbi:MAG: hypothetical protein K5650_02650 [Bacteroidales bacterium]|nr:hypothetical protein [Bacteroidales bacterium]
MSKKALSILLCTALLAGFTSQAQNIIDKQGRRQGHWIKTDKDGSKIYEGDFVNGLETGTFTYYYHDGTVRMKNTYIIDGQLCSHEAYDDKGRIVATGYYNKHNRDSVWRFYNEQGALVKSTTYKMGIKHGPSVIFTSAGDTAEVSNWVDNHRHGRWWKRVGRHGYITGTYVKGGLEGRLIEVDDSARLVREGNYRNGLKHGNYRFYEGNIISIDETWSDGRMADRKVLVLTPEPQYISIYDIVCLAPQGKNRVQVYLKDGGKVVSREPADNLFARIGNELFATANRKNRVLVSMRCVEGIGKDPDGRDVLTLTNPIDLTIFPDEDCIKMVQSRQYEEHSPLDEQ